MAYFVSAMKCTNIWCLHPQRGAVLTNIPALLDRTFIISSFGKTFHVTGWKLGYCIAPANLTLELRKIHQYVTFSSFTPAQYAIATMLEQAPELVTGLADFYRQKRDLFASLLASSPFKLLPCAGTYFQLADYSALSSMPDVEFLSVADRRTSGGGDSVIGILTPGTG